MEFLRVDAARWLWFPSLQSSPVDMGILISFYFPETSVNNSRC